MPPALHKMGTQAEKEPAKDPGISDNAQSDCPKCEDFALAPVRPLPGSGCPAEGDRIPEEVSSKNKLTESVDSCTHGDMCVSYRLGRESCGLFLTPCAHTGEKGSSM